MRTTEHTFGSDGKNSHAPPIGRSSHDSLWLPPVTPPPPPPPPSSYSCPYAKTLSGRGIKFSPFTRTRNRIHPVLPPEPNRGLAGKNSPTMWRTTRPLAQPLACLVFLVTLVDASRCKYGAALASGLSHRIWARHSPCVFVCCGLSESLEQLQANFLARHCQGKKNKGQSRGSVSHFQQRETIPGPPGTPTWGSLPWFWEVTVSQWPSFLAFSHEE